MRNNCREIQESIKDTQEGFKIVGQDLDPTELQYADKQSNNKNNKNNNIVRNRQVKGVH